MLFKSIMLSALCLFSMGCWLNHSSAKVEKYSYESVLQQVSIGASIYACDAKIEVGTKGFRVIARLYETSGQADVKANYQSFILDNGFGVKSVVPVQQPQTVDTELKAIYEPETTWYSGQGIDVIVTIKKAGIEYLIRCPRVSVPSTR